MDFARKGAVAVSRGHIEPHDTRSVETFRGYDLVPDPSQSVCDTCYHDIVASNVPAWLGFLARKLAAVAAGEFVHFSKVCVICMGNALRGFATPRYEIPFPFGLLPLLLFTRALTFPFGLTYSFLPLFFFEFSFLAFLTFGRDGDDAFHVIVSIVEMVCRQVCVDDNVRNALSPLSFWRVAVYDFHAAGDVAVRQTKHDVGHVPHLVFRVEFARFEFDRHVCRRGEMRVAMCLALFERHKSKGVFGVIVFLQQHLHKPVLGMAPRADALIPRARSGRGQSTFAGRIFPPFVFEIRRRRSALAICIERVGHAKFQRTATFVHDFLLVYHFCGSSPCPRGRHPRLFPLFV